MTATIAKWRAMCSVRGKCLHTPVRTGDTKRLSQRVAPCLSKDKRALLSLCAGCGASQKNVVTRIRIDVLSNESLTMASKGHHTIIGGPNCTRCPPLPQFVHVLVRLLTLRLLLLF